jgi:3-oxoacyl-[acyl-carrier-protein] synthase-1
MESGFCALGLRDGFTPGNAHLTRLEPLCEGINVLRTTLPTAPEIVMKNSSGFGGANVALVFKRIAA